MFSRRVIGIWMPEIRLAVGRERGTYLGRTREWLYWYDQQGNRLPTPEELIEQERQRAEQAEQALRELRAQLQRKGIDLEA